MISQYLTALVRRSAPSLIDQSCLFYTTAPSSLPKIGKRGKDASGQVSPAVHTKDYDKNGTLAPILCYFMQGKCHPAHPAVNWLN